MHHSGQNMPCLHLLLLLLLLLLYTASSHEWHTCVPPVYNVAYTAVLLDDLAEKYSAIVGSRLLANTGHEGMPR